MLTVLMGVYNGEIYLTEAMDSVLQQTFSDFEFLIINDGSTDRTSEILYSYQDSRIRIISNEKNIGLTKSLNIGLRESRGQLVARQDADDVSKLERFGAQVKILHDSPKVVLASSWCELADEEGRLFGCIQPRTTRSDLLKRFSEADSPFPHGSVMYRKKSVLDIGGYDERFWYAQDFDLWLRLLNNSEAEVAVVPEVLYRIRKTIPTKEFKGICQRRYAEVSWEQHCLGDRIDFPDVRGWVSERFPLTTKDSRRSVDEHWLFLSLTALQNDLKSIARLYARRALRSNNFQVRYRAMWRIILSILPHRFARILQEKFWLLKR